MLEVMEIISIAMQKGIRIYTVKGGWQLDDSIQSKVMALVFAMASETERDLISKRTKETLAAKKLSGIKLGRPTGPGKSKLDQFRPEIEALLLNGSGQKYIADRYQITEATLSNWIKKNSIKKYRKAA
jgi:DNA invertase Pin-like site-specific DNA recombinase